GTTLLLHSVTGISSPRVLLVGLGKESEFSEKEYRQAVRASLKALSNGGTSDAASFLAELPVKKHDITWKVAQHAEVAMDGAYRFDQMKGKSAKEKSEPAKKLTKLVINVPQQDDIEKAEDGLKAGRSIALGVSFAKDLGNLPPNVCTPTYLAEQALALAKSHGITVEVL